MLIDISKILIKQDLNKQNVFETYANDQPNHIEHLYSVLSLYSIIFRQIFVLIFILKISSPWSQVFVAQISCYSSP